jgi:CD2 antigen cytoplasmic tail-binding protein 2
VIPLISCYSASADLLNELNSSYNSPPAQQGDSTKRVRYASEDEDDNLIADAGELDFPNRKARRGAVKDTEGYQSDSSNEDDETMIKRDSRTSAMDEEDDMFGTPAEPTSGKTGVPGLNTADNDTRVKDTGLQLQGDAAKGGKEFLELGDIEGQEFGDDERSKEKREEALKQAKKVTEDDEDYISGDEKANDDDAVIPAERKSQTGLGFAISSFNMKDEMSEGRFTADGTYQANSKDPDSVYDNWLGGVTTKDIEAAQKAKERQDALVKQRAEQIAASSMSRIDCLIALLEGNGGLVKPGESVQAALARLGKARKEEVEQEKERLKKERRQNKASSSKPKKDFDAPDEPEMRHPASAESSNKTETQDMDLDPLAVPNPSLPSTLAKGKGREIDASNDSPTKIAIDRLTTLASTLLGVHGETDIYEETHEGIIRQLIAEGEVPRGWTPKNDDSAGSEANGKQGNGSNGRENTRKSVISRPLISRPRA